MDETQRRNPFFPFPPPPFLPFPNPFADSDEAMLPPLPPPPQMPEPVAPPVTVEQLERARDDFKAAAAPLSVLHSFVETVNSAFETMREGLKLWGPPDGGGDITAGKPPHRPRV